MPFRFAVLLLLLCVRIAGAAELYVSPAGSDTNDGSSPAQAFQTIQWAAYLAGAGDTVRIMAGTYVESVRLFNSGAPGSPIVFTPFGDGPVIMDGANIGCPGGVTPNFNATVPYAFWCGAQDDIVIENLEITRFCYLGIDLEGCSRVTVRDCFVHHNGLNLPSTGGQGIYTNGPGSDVLIERNIVTDNVPQNSISGSGIAAVGLDRVTIRDNVSDRNNGNGILLEDATNVLVEGNVARFNVADLGTWGTAGLWLDGGHDVTIRNNWFEGNVWAGMELTDEEGANPYGYEVYDNVCVGNRYGVWLDGIGRDGEVLNRIYNNTVIDSTEGGIWVSASAGMGAASVASPLTRTRVSNNLVAQLAQDQPALQVDDGPYADVVFDTNLYYRAGSTTPIRWAGADLTFGSYQATSGWDGAGVSADPLLEDPAVLNYRLLAASPAINVASPAFASAADFEGKPRPQGAGGDLGAFEYGATTADVVINWFDTSPAMLEAGSGRPATLTWSTWQATQVTIDNGVGTVNGLGSVAVMAPATTTYTLTAEGTGGPVTAQVTVTVVDPNPHCSAPASAGRAKLKLHGLDKPPGSQKLTVKANVDFALPLVPFAPAVHGVHVFLSEGPLGQVVDELDFAVPAGLKGAPEGCDRRDGWKLNGKLTTFKYGNKSGALDPPSCVPGSAAGVQQVQLKDKVAKGKGLDLQVKGKNGSWQSSGQGDRMATVRFDDGTCRWVRFEPAECKVTPRSVSCRQR